MVEKSREACGETSLSDPVPDLFVAFCLGEVLGVLQPHRGTAAISFSASAYSFLEAAQAHAFLLRRMPGLSAEGRCWNCAHQHKFLAFLCALPEVLPSTNLKAVSAASPVGPGTRADEVIFISKSVRISATPLSSAQALSLRSCITRASWGSALSTCCACTGSPERAHHFSALPSPRCLCVAKAAPPRRHWERAPQLLRYIYAHSSRAAAAVPCTLTHCFSLASLKRLLFPGGTSWKEATRRGKCRRCNPPWWIDYCAERSFFFIPQIFFFFLRSG